MAPNMSADVPLQLTISLAEVTQLKTENAALKQKVADLETEVERLKKQLQSSRSSHPLPMANRAMNTNIRQRASPSASAGYRDRSSEHLQGSFLYFSRHSVLQAPLNFVTLGGYEVRSQETS